MPLKVIDEKTTEGKYITFNNVGLFEGDKVSAYSVRANGEEAELGKIRWFNRWNKYVLVPNTNLDTCFEETCLRDIAEFCETRTREEKAR